MGKPVVGVPLVVARWDEKGLKKGTHKGCPYGGNGKRKQCEKIGVNRPSAIGADESRN